ncbi:MAG: hypothetical protein HYW48_07930 [Deltaproteobacteria bacterium]|nr:hypothetical protein [Deltaproteobacteria bacterium]
MLRQLLKTILIGFLLSYTSQCKSEQKGGKPQATPTGADVSPPVPYAGQSSSPELPATEKATDPLTGRLTTTIAQADSTPAGETQKTQMTGGGAVGANASDLYSMTPAQLRKVPAITLEPELIKLREQNKLEEDQLRKIQAFNAAMCQRMETLKKQCVAQHLLVPATGASDLTCTPGEEEAESEIEAEVQNAGAYTFRLKANKDYISDEFGSGRTIIRFSRTDNRLVKAPRFREVTSLTLVSVTPNSKIELGRIQHPTDIKNQDQLSSTMKLRIYVNGTLLVESSEKGAGWLRLAPNTKTKSELLVAPEDILKMGRTESCMITLEEINEIRRQAEKGSP